MKMQRRRLMAIHPIDLQALFTQLDKVAKNQAVMRDGAQIQESLQQIQNQKKLEENVRSVNEAQNMGEEAGKVKDDNRRGANENNGGPKEKKAKTEEEAEADERRDLIRDPALGRNIDISG